jgi:hypothetical protein
MNVKIATQMASGATPARHFRDNGNLATRARKKTGGGPPGFETLDVRAAV